MQRWIERSEARWALWAGVVGALATAALSTKMILSHGGSTAGLGFIFLPLVAAAAAVPIAIWGAALGHVVAHLRGRASEPRAVFWVALAAAAGAALLERIASLEDPALAQPMGSLWDVMGENRKGEPVLALAARHPNAPASVKRRAPR
jgi:hypothetical protein